MDQEKILVIDDDIHIRQIVTIKLEGAGFTVKPVANGTLGLEAAKTFLPDLIVSDFSIPGGIQGVELLRELRAREETADVPIILLTSSAEVATNVDENIGDLAGVTYLAKPFSPRNLVKQAKELLGV
ncbi:response regulator [Candidatus Hydrogenedentota bacterium]